MKLSFVFQWSVEFCNYLVGVPFSLFARCPSGWEFIWIFQEIGVLENSVSFDWQRRWWFFVHSCFVCLPTCALWTGMVQFYQKPRHATAEKHFFFSSVTFFSSEKAVLMVIGGDPSFVVSVNRSIHEIKLRKTSRKWLLHGGFFLQSLVSSTPCLFLYSAIQRAAWVSCAFNWLSLWSANRLGTISRNLCCRKLMSTVLQKLYASKTVRPTLSTSLLGRSSHAFVCQSDHHCI